MGRIKEKLLEISEYIVKHYVDVESLESMDEESKLDAIYGCVENYIDDSTNRIEKHFATENVDSIIDFIKEILEYSQSTTNHRITRDDLEGYIPTSYNANEAMDYDAMARRNRELDRSPRFVGGYNRPIAPKEREEDDIFDSPNKRREMEELKTNKKSYENDILNVEKVIDDIAAMEEIIKSEKEKLKDVKKTSEVTRMKLEIDKKIKEVKELKNKTKKTLTQLNGEIRKIDAKVNKMVTKAQRGRALD